MSHWIRKIVLGMALLGAGFTQAVEVAVPPALEPWRDWVLDAHRDLACPPHYARLGERHCRWPGRLTIDAGEQGAVFAQDWQLYNEGWVMLPGDARHWPQAVRANDRVVPVVERDGRPAVWLPPGEFQVSGVLRWTQVPSRLPLPEDSGLLALTLHGTAVAMPSIDAQGRLLFGETRPADNVADSLSVQVFRQLQDDIPLQLETVLRLRVAGRDRELLLGRWLPEGFLPLALDTPLPARLEADGRLRVQVRPGEWELTLRARAEGQPMAFAMQALDERWPGDEVWTLRDNRGLRQVTVSGAPSIDPSQTDMPAAWRELPAWLLRPGDTLQLAEVRRGEPLVDGAVAGEEWTLQRELWLDFDGQGITSRDSISGVLQQATRLSTAPGQALGRADVNGQPQLITRLDGQAGEDGLELRPGPLQLLGISRIEAPQHVSATGWAHDFHRVSATLHLPPGWKLLHASGTDAAEYSWLSRWNLWAIFLVLVTAAASGRLLGAGTGVLALAALLLTYHAPYAPVFFWLAVLVLLAAQHALPMGRLRDAVRIVMVLAFIGLVLMLLQFTVDQARRSLYPQLELGRYVEIRQRHAAEPPAAAAPAQEMAMTAELAEGRAEKNALYDARPRSLPAPALEPLKSGYDTQAKVQTGPGEPAWQWQQVALHWSGPVTAAQSVRLYLLAPGWHRVWNLASVLLALALAARLARAAFPAVAERRPAGAALAVLLACLLGGQSGHVTAEAFPDPALLAELEKRLTRAPACEPVCAGVSRGLLQLDPAGLRIELQLDAQTAVAVPLPAARNQWQPRTVLVDGETAAALRTDAAGVLWLSVPAGSHRVLLEGPLVTDTVTLPFEMPVHNLVAEAKGWQVSGLGAEGQVPGRSLQLRREVTDSPAGQPTQLLPEPAPPFLRVTRTLVLGLEWAVQTRVDRLAPQAGAITAAVPLLPGEAVLTPGVDVRQGKVQLVISTHSPGFSWHSSLKQANALTLSAPEGVPWVEHWQFDVAPLWHVAFDGIPPVKQPMADGNLPRWQPWPGEQLALAIQRPEAVTGPTHTVESAELDVRPGARAREASLTLQVRSSQGSELPLSLPPGGVLQRVLIDGVEQSYPGDDATLRLPLRPGSQQLAVHWREEGGIAWREFTPLPVIEEPLANIGLRVEVPQGRWLLAVGGPAMGPAILVWGVLLVIVLVSVGLGRSRVAPVATWQWILLGLGMSTVNSAGSLLVVLWFIAMARRQGLDTASLTRTQFNTLQVVLAVLTVLALGSLVGTIPMSLLSSPDMQVAGNQSTATLLQWYQDRTAAGLPQAWVVSLPMWVYRAVMLVWSLWLVFALLGWCRWGWQAFSAREWWRSEPPPAAPGMTLDDELLR